MGNVDFGYAVTQDDALIPDRYTLDSNVHVWVLDGGALATHEIATGVYVLDTVVDGTEVEEIDSNLWLVNVGGTATPAVIKAALKALVERNDPPVHAGAGRYNDAASTVDTADSSTDETATALAPGTWTPT